MLPSWCAENKAALELSRKRWWIDLDQNKLYCLPLLFWGFTVLLLHLLIVVTCNLFREEMQKEKLFKVEVLILKLTLLAL